MTKIDDIKVYKIFHYFWTVALLAPTVVFVMGMKRGAWHVLAGTELRADGLYDIYEFSVRRFVESPIGVAIIISTLILTALSWYYYLKFASKSGKGPWFY